MTESANNQVPMPAIRLVNVSKSFGRTRVLNDISLDVADSEVLTVVGPSGCGKSTLLRILAGLESPSSGELWMHGAAMTAVPARDRNIAMVFQSYALYPHLTCRENLALNLRLKGVPAGEIDFRVDQTARVLEISDLLAKRPRELSGGERQRVAVGRALIRNPRLFLLDEPLSNLDALLRERVRHELKSLFRKVSVPVVYVTHDQIEAMTLADRVAVLNEGRLQQVGTPEDLYRHPANRFVASFIGSPSMSLFDTNLENGAFTLAGVRLDIRIPISRQVTIGIRPEAIRVAKGIKATVDWVESLGAQTLVGILLGQTKLTLVAPARPVSDTIEVAFDLEQIHVFDKHSGENLRFRRTEPVAGSKLQDSGLARQE